ncbi:MAG: hypothetical protein MUO62_01535, partial [Anaerolineales bacterium]|nr:hypothetical protein [Anaerolineales bacterium]
IREPQTLDRIFRVATFFSKKWTQQAGHTGQSLGSLRWQQVLDSFSVFTALPDRGTFYNPGRAMLPSLLAPLFFVGVFVLAARWRRPPALSLLAWILVVLTLGSVLINTAATFQRLLGLYPAVILVTAIGLETGARALSQRLSLKGVTPGRLVYAALVVAAASNLFFYFYVFNTRVVWKPADYEAVPIAVREYGRLDGQGTFILHTRIGVGEDGTMYRPLVKLAAGQDFLGSTPQMDLSASPRPIRFYLLHDKLDDLPNLQQTYPGGEVRSYWRRADWELIMIRYTLP